MASNTHNTFELFPNLPLELRRKIWLHSLPHSHTFQLNVHHPDAIGSRAGIKARFPEQSLLNDPTALRTSRESRTVALEHYVRKAEYYSLWFLFVDYAVDVFEMYIYREMVEASDISDDVAQIQNLIVHPISVYRLEMVVDWFVKWLATFPSLVLVTFDVSNMGETLDIARAKAVMAKVHAAVVTLGNQQREAGESWRALDLNVKLQKNDGFCYEARWRIEDTPDHPLA